MSRHAQLAKNAKEAARQLATLTAEQKNNFLLKLSVLIRDNIPAILGANQRDIEECISNNSSKAFIDRLTLTESRVQALSQSLIALAELEDPVGRVIETKILPNKLKIIKKSVPFGSILIVYESRPNVTIDAACLCLKSGNASILKGGKEAIRSNQILCDLMKEALRNSGLPDDSITLITENDRSELYQLLKLDRQIDLVIPRGGENLVNAVSEHSRIPVLKNAKGLCHTFVDESADIHMALAICDNAKTQRPGVCNAMETLLVHKNIAAIFIPELVRIMQSKSVELRGDPASRAISPAILQASESDWDEEYGDLILAIKVVDSLDDCLSHISIHGSGHSEAIITASESSKIRFLNEVDAAAVYCNASTRFTDGGEFGLGAEIGISTGKLHARGPMGLRELTTYKYLIEGQGQIRK